MFLPGDRDLDFPRDGLCDFTFQGECVAEFTVVGFGPKVFVGRATNQLGRDSNPTAVSYERPFNKGIHV